MVGTLVSGCRCAASWSDLDLTFDRVVLTFDLVVVTLTFKILLHLWVCLLMQIKHC